jgi:cyclic di-GMP phosphodiesterase
VNKSTEVTQRAKILIVEDEPGPQEALTLVLRPFFDVYWAESANAALQTIKDVPDIDVITLDLVLPGRSGVELLQDLRRDHDSIEVIILTGYGALLSAIDCFRHGAAAYLIKPFDQTDVLREVNMALVRKHRLKGLRGYLADSRGTTQQRLTPEAARRCLAKHPQLLEHAQAVCRYALELADRLRLSRTDRQHLELGALLHDVGLIAIDDEIAHYHTMRELSVEDIQQAHTQTGARMALDAQLATPIIEIIQYHHERHDGSGYPHHLLGEDIPYLARIVAIANSIDHVTSTNATKRLTPKDVHAFLKLNAGSRFDPWLVELRRSEL